MKKTEGMENTKGSDKMRRKKARRTQKMERIKRKRAGKESKCVIVS
jgi:hypothetical protein